MKQSGEHGGDLRKAGARGDGTGDASPVFDEMIRKGVSPIWIPPGDYQVSRPVRLRSGMRLMAHPGARIRIADGVEWGVRDALLTNADWEAGNRSIEVAGGVWDGNNPKVRRAAEDEQSGYTGNLFLFRNVEGLVLRDMTLVDPVSYFVCLGKVRKFLVESIRFEILHHTRNQDGIHVSGHCEDGIIRDLRGYGKYCPGDDLVALNACDALDRSETRSALAGPIRRIAVSRLFAEDCHAFMRFASVWSSIEDVDVHDVQGGCVDAAFNADALRFCRSPLFDMEDPAFANGCGDLRNIRIRKVRVWKTRDLGSGMLQFHSRLNHCLIEDFERVLERDRNPAHPTLDFGFVPGASGFIEGLTPSDCQDLLANSNGVEWNWQSPGGFHDSACAGRFRLRPKGHIKGGLRRLPRLAVESTPMQALPEPNWNKGMTR